MAQPADPDLHFVTITRARYGGMYEPGEWLAFPLPPSGLPYEWDADDVTCLRFWETRHDVGGGSSPDEALADLLRRARGHAEPTESAPNGMP